MGYVGRECGVVGGGGGGGRRPGLFVFMTQKVNKEDLLGNVVVYFGLYG